MNKILLAATCLLLVVFPACRKKQVKKVAIAQQESSAIMASEDVAGRSLFLDESVGELELLDDEVKSGARPVDVATQSMVASDSLFEQVTDREALSDKIWASRRIEQAKYGLQNIYFDLNRYVIRPSERSKLDSNVAAVKKVANMGRVVVVEGHACRYGGSPAYNMMLSEKRAKVVADYLVKNGVPRDQLKVVGRGNEMPLVFEDGKVQQAQNRRVELYLLEA